MGTTARKRSAGAKQKTVAAKKTKKKRTRYSAPTRNVPIKVRKGETIEKKKRDGSGPLEWLLPTLETAYMPLVAAYDQTPPAVSAMAVSSIASPGVAAVAAAPAAIWRDILQEYKQRKAQAVAPPPAMAMGMPPGAPFVPGARNWLPLGPSVVMNGQTVGDQPVGGRVARLAIAVGGSVVYAATANGGVFRSADGGTSWRAMMDRFDLNPTNFASASLICGAIALDQNDPNRVYVGTGEGDTLQLFRSRVTNALPAYRGVGVIRTDDGGVNWIAENSAPDLAGEAFFALAVDPRNRENVVGATTNGLYRRVSQAGGQFQWTRVRSGVHASVVAVADANSTRFYCAEWDPNGVSSKVFHSSDGANWTPTGTAFPSGAGRIALGVQPNKPNLVYAFVASTGGALFGLFRLDGVTSAWKRVSNVPNVLPGGQGDYDLTIAVDPVNPGIVYLGGDRMTTPPWGGSIWRCTVQASGASFNITQSASIGTHAHADVHQVIHSPGQANELWCATDGGVFLNRDPRGTGRFVSQNNGLACLCSNFIAQHPTDPNILFTGLQDNGTARSATGAIWNHVGGGDGGYCLINSTNPNQVLIYMNGVVYRSTTGGASHAGWAPVWNFGWRTMTQPFVSLNNPMTAADAKIVAVGAGPTVYISSDFATSWGAQFNVPGPAAGDVFALAFASRTRLFIATTLGRVFRADRVGANWTASRIDNVAAGPLGLVGLIADIAVDWADAGLQSVYVAFGGMGDRRRVWWFNGTRWQSRSGTNPASSLLNVEHNALAVDRTSPNNVYVGADIGVWHSPDRGLTWQAFENGLPDAPVFDLQIHPAQRLLRAATHGRGVYEVAL